MDQPMAYIELKGFKGLRELHSINQSTVASQSFEKVEKLPLISLHSGKYQPRTHFNEDAIQELADSIKSQGIIQPVIVRKLSGNAYEIIAGERRCRAAKLAGLTHVPAIVKEIKDDVAMAFSLIENIQRENLNPIEEAVAFDRFRKDFSMTHDEIAEMVGRSRTAITNALRLLLLAPAVKTLLEKGKLEMGHARALLMLEPDQQHEIALLIERQQLSVRETEKLANAAKQRLPENGKKALSLYHQQCEAWSRDLSQKFSANVSVKLNVKGSGQVTIQVDSPEQVEWLIQRIKID